MNHHDHHEPAPFLGILVLFFGLFAVAPGALLVVVVADQALGLGLDRGQHWAWSCAASAVVLVGLRVALGGWWTAIGRYAQAAVGVVALVAFARFGLHCEWPRVLVMNFFGR